MKIGEVAEASRTKVATIRFYETEGLMPPPKRSSANYRIYEQAHVRRLRFIRHCRAFDMNLDEIRALLSATEAMGTTCDVVNTLLDDHIADVGKRIEDLQAIDRELRALRNRCEKGRRADQCGILSELSAANLPVPTADNCAR